MRADRKGLETKEMGVREEERKLTFKVGWRERECWCVRKKSENVR